jgi:predicted  nucleic acid-binding Zn-ribbon protein
VGGKMKTFMLYFVAFLLLCAYIFAQNYIERGRQINTLEGEKNELISQLKSKEKEIENYNQKQLEASNTIEKVREVVKTVKEPCNCYGVALPARIADILHNNNQ